MRGQPISVHSPLAALEYSPAATRAGVARLQAQWRLEDSPSLKRELGPFVAAETARGIELAIADLRGARRDRRGQRRSSGGRGTPRSRCSATGSRKRRGASAQPINRSGATFDVGRLSLGDPSASEPSMIDPFGRTITYLRVSVTDRCDLRCVYCMAEEMTFLPKAELLTLEELDRVCGAFVRLGVEKDPPDRRRAAGAARRHDAVPRARPPSRGRRAGRADPHHQRHPAGPLCRPSCAMPGCGGSTSRSTRSTRRASPRSPAAAGSSRCSTGIVAAKAAGLAVKINTVALQGVNEDEFDHLVAWCGEQGFDLCSIETMPMGEIEREPPRPVPAAVGGARAAAAALDAGRDRLSHRRPGALCRRARRPAGGSASSRR